MYISVGQRWEMLLRQNLITEFLQWNKVPTRPRFSSIQGYQQIRFGGKHTSYVLGQFLGFRGKHFRGGLRYLGIQFLLFWHYRLKTDFNSSHHRRPFIGRGIAAFLPTI